MPRSRGIFDRTGLNYGRIKMAFGARISTQHHWGNAMIVRMLLLLLGIFHIVNGLFMLIAPAEWYATVPGVTLTGPFNPHFILDIGMAFVASGAGLILGARRSASASIFAVAGATWPALHALIHIDGWLMHGFPADTQIALSEAIGVVGLALLGAVLAWMRMKEELA